MLDKLRRTPCVGRGQSRFYHKRSAQSPTYMQRMLKLILGRLLQGLIVLLIVSALTFTLLPAAGGDALTALQSDPLVSEQTITEMRRTFGLDQPLHVRYLHWLGDLAHARMGQSFFYKAPVSTIIC